jgi:hypothetical protein
VRIIETSSEGSIEVGAHSTDNNENRARSYREQVLEEHDTIQATRYRGA